MSNNQNLYGLVDQWGRALRPSERDESLLGHYEGFAAIAMATPSFSPDVFINTRGWAALEDMLSMGAVRTPLNIIRDAVLCKGWRVAPAISDKSSADYEKAKELADALTYALDNIVDSYGNATDFRQVLFELLYAIHTGFRITEIEWRTIESGDYAGQWGFASFGAKPCKQIGFDMDAETMMPRGITAYTPSKGYRYAPIEKVLRYTFAPNNGMPHGMGIGRAAYKHSWSLDFLYRFWNICLEQFGSGFILAKAPTQTMNLARKVLKEIRQGAPAVVPEDVEASLIEMSGKGAEAFKASADHHIGEIGKLYTYAALTSGEGERTGSMALGSVHQDTQGYGLGGRRTDIENIIRFQLIRRWLRYNYGDELTHLAPSVSLGEADESDLEKLSKGFERLVNADVLHPAEDQIRERMGLGPIDPELREIMMKVWQDRSKAPATIPGTTPTDDTEDDDEDDTEE
ncbi:DUF935 family protein [Armatimonas sp.]|uniref:phage portal protein family protein n=1 Tax=Armatimonas sp. TaxID=1872638 RepID=UPI00374CEDB3